MKFTAHKNWSAFIYTFIVLLVLLVLLILSIFVEVWFILPIFPELWWAVIILIIVLTLLLTYLLFFFGELFYLFVRGGTYEITSQSLIVKPPLRVKAFEVSLDNIIEVKAVNWWKGLRLSKWGKLASLSGLSTNLVEIRFKEPQVVYLSGRGLGAIWGRHLPSWAKEGIRISVDQREKFIDSLKKAIQSNT